MGQSQLSFLKRKADNEDGSIDKKINLEEADLNDSIEHNKEQDEDDKSECGEIGEEYDVITMRGIPRKFPDL